MKNHLWTNTVTLLSHLQWNLLCTVTYLIHIINCGIVRKITIHCLQSFWVLTFTNFCTSFNHWIQLRHGQKCMVLLRELFAGPLVSFAQLRVAVRAVRTHCKRVLRIYLVLTVSLAAKFANKSSFKQFVIVILHNMSESLLNF